ncbi:MAG: tRNA epoxyqueuosine(34) reductase QueG [Aeromonas sp.]
MHTPTFTPDQLSALSDLIQQWGRELGFAAVGICDTDLRLEEPKLSAWLAAGYHGGMEYMARHGMLRARADELHPGTLRVISARMDYLPPNAACARTLSDTSRGYISRYALGRDYHKLMRQRLKQLGERIDAHCQTTLNWRPFVDSAPILERPLAVKAGLGATGKHTLLIAPGAGSFSFLGEILIGLPLPISPVASATDPCGACVACLKACPTGAIVAPYVVDARRCLSYLSIEHAGAIPVEFRAAMGNRLYGCDDCQLICPHNRDAKASAEADFTARSALHQPDLLSLWLWDEAAFLKATEGSPIRRIGYARWRRNLAVVLGNGPATPEVIAALSHALPTADALLAEHITWALAELTARGSAPALPSKATQRLIRAIEKGLPDHA